MACDFADRARDEEQDESPERYGTGRCLHTEARHVFKALQSAGATIARCEAQAASSADVAPFRAPQPRADQKDRRACADGGAPSGKATSDAAGRHQPQIFASDATRRMWHSAGVFQRKALGDLDLDRTARLRRRLDLRVSLQLAMERGPRAHLPSAPPVPSAPPAAARSCLDDRLWIHASTAGSVGGVDRMGAGHYLTAAMS
jgi:hypothetical protein